ncbi:MAG: LuxR C-terminal-related transcriptional regulator [Leifsonia sp.]
MPGPTLTPRESAVLAAVERRLGNSEIASELFISVRTVESHIASLRRKLGAETRADLIAAAAERRATAIRLPENAFVGRADELRIVSGLIEHLRWITITGPGGVGKTRLALELAGSAALTPVVVELEHAEPGDVVGRIARALALEAAPATDAAAAVVSALASQPYLLVLDNIDRVGPAVGEIVAQITRSAPTARVLTTSRTPIGDPAETVFALTPLGVDGPDAAALAMFIDRLGARAVTMTTRPERERAARIVARLDGLPLAIELAAAVARHLSIEELAERLDRDFAALDRAVPEGRHRTVETAFEWTWDLLTADERDALCRLAALPHTFDVDLAVAVTHPGADGIVLRLLDHSLLVPAGGRPRRFRLLAVLREFVRARTDPAVIHDALERHAVYHADLAEHFAARARTDDSAEAMATSHRMCAEVNAALRWALAADHPRALTLAVSLSTGVEQYGSDIDSIRTIAMSAADERAMAGASAQDLLVIGIALSFIDLPLVSALADRAQAIADDPPSRLAALHLAGMAEAYTERPASALEHLDAAEDLAARMDDPWELAAVSQMRGVALRSAALNRPEAAIAAFETAMNGYAAAGDRVHVSNCRYMMALTAAESGLETERAAVWAAECADYARAAGNDHELAHAELVQQLLGRGARTDLDELLSTFRHLGDMRCSTRCLLLQADRSREDEREEILLRALALADAAGDTGHQTLIRERLAGLRVGSAR